MVCSETVSAVALPGAQLPATTRPVGFPLSTRSNGGDAVSGRSNGGDAVSRRSNGGDIVHESNGGATPASKGGVKLADPFCGTG